MSKAGPITDPAGQGPDDPNELNAETEEFINARVQEEFECMNTTSEVINRLENELDHARSKFRSLLSESTQQLNGMVKRMGKSITKARPYYDLLKQSRAVQLEAQRAVVQFQRANSVYRSAKETVAQTEGRMRSQDSDQRQLNPVWQDVLNHATIKFMESKNEKQQTEENHLLKAAECAEIEQKRKFMEKDMHRTIPKVRPYFELKEKLELQLKQEKQNVEDLQMALQSAKSQYHRAMHNLEIISNQVHQQRQLKTLPPRTPGVGAETDNISLPSIDLDCTTYSASDRLDSESTSSCHDGCLRGDDQDSLSSSTKECYSCSDAVTSQNQSESAVYDEETEALELHSVMNDDAIWDATISDTDIDEMSDSHTIEGLNKDITGHPLDTQHVVGLSLKVGNLHVAGTGHDSQ